jgi:single-strand DNA-binding protein
MSNLNSMLLEGKLVKDPSCRINDEGILMCTIQVTSRRDAYRGRASDNEVSMITVETHDKLAEQCRKSGRKGRSLRVLGRLTQDGWFDEVNKEHARLKVVADYIEFIPGAECERWVAVAE